MTESEWVLRGGPNPRDNSYCMTRGGEISVIEKGHMLASVSE